MATQSVSPKTKDRVRKRAGGRCEYCRCPEDFSSDPFSIEHIQPVALNGTNRLTNLALSCQGCNGIKGARTIGKDPETGESVRFFHPRQQRWSHHFTWGIGDDITKIEPLTDVGRTTLKALKLNRNGVVNLRRVLIFDGRHPPD